MDAELKRELDALKGELGKNVEALARVDKIETAALQRDADTKKLREELDAVKASHVEREKAIQDLQRQGRAQAIQRDHNAIVIEATENLGMIVREMLCKRLGCELPSAFVGEPKLVRERIQRATLAADAVTGSYLVPTITEAQLIDTLEEVSDLLSLVEFMPGLPAAGTIYIPTLTGRPTLQPARASSDTAMTQSDPAFGLMEMSPKESYFWFPVDNRLIQMSAINLGNLVSGLMRDWVVGGICNWLLNADGTANYNFFTGILNESSADYISALPSGKKAFSDLTAQDMRKIKGATLKRGRAKGVWLCSLDVQGLMEDFDRTGKLPFVKEMPDGSMKALQNPIVNDEGMPDIADSAENKTFLGYGDLATFIVGLVGGIQLATSADYRFGNNQTSYRALLNMAIKRKPVNTLRIMKTAAA